MLAAPAILLAPAVRAQGGFDWRRFAGQRITVSLLRAPLSDLLQRHEQEFTERTGIAVASEQVPEQQHRQQQVIELASGRPSFDVTTVSWLIQKRLFGRARWLEDLRPYIADPALTAPDFAPEDLTPAGLAGATHPDGRVDSLPLALHYFILYANRSLLEAKGVAVPTDFASLEEAARRLTDRSAGVFGFVGRGLRNANVPLWTAFLLGWGKEALSPDGTLLTDGDEAVAAAELYARLLRETAPPGVAGFNWAESLSAFTQGRAAMWIDNANWASPLEDAQRSRVAGKVIYATVPRGPAAHHTTLFGDGIAIPAASPRKGPAWFYAQWAAGKANAARSLIAGVGAPPRRSTFADPTVREELRLPRPWLDAVEASAAIARPGLPDIIPVTEFRDTFGAVLTSLIGGGDARAELRRATAAFRPVLEASERG
ncbi:ABC transporter substrate-binding protein [Muricoccus radiodurans]|uniref:ABC transporter substrate-binding protein n=1 Tax=Muricoccus radiodurans TaxID=2231721 RepID=UPI003CF8A512